MDAPFEYDGGDFVDDFTEFAQELGRGNIRSLATTTTTPATMGRGGSSSRGRGKRRVVASLSSSTSTLASSPFTPSAPTSTPPADDVAPPPMSDSGPGTGSGGGISRYQSTIKSPPIPFSDRVYLSVPFEEKDQVKSKGAKWDPAKKKWWISNDKATAEVIEKWGGGSATRTDPVVAPREDTPRARSDTTLRGWFDGGSRGNPGHCGYGAILRAGNGSVLGVRVGGWHKGTNNEAEYTGCQELLTMILGALREAPTSSLPGRKVEIRGDSKMVIQQIRGEWECHADNLRGYMEKCRSLIGEIRSLISPGGEILIEHVLREYNKEADALSNIGMDQVQPASYSR